jgi:hypothetical protein
LLATQRRATVCAFHGSWLTPPGVAPAQRGVPAVSETTHACSVVAGRRPRSGKLTWPGSGVNPRPARLASVSEYSGTTMPLPNLGNELEWTRTTTVPLSSAAETNDVPPGSPSSSRWRRIAPITAW